MNHNPIIRSSFNRFGNLAFPLSNFRLGYFKWGYRFTQGWPFVGAKGLPYIGHIYRYLVYSCYLMLLMTEFSCAYNVEDELYPPVICDTISVTYSGSVLPIVEKNCYMCHSNENVNVSEILLEGYSNIIVKVNDGKLLAAIRHETGAPPMPKDRPQLDKCDILKIEKWIAEGAPDN